MDINNLTFNKILLDNIEIHKHYFQHFLTGIFT